MLQSFRVLVMATVAASVLAGIAAGPALAEDRDHRRPEARHVVRHRAPERGDRGRDWGYGVPTYEAAPPPVVYAPAPEPAFNLSLHFR
jgi:Ni/Co efflux regulator RcnB